MTPFKQHVLRAAAALGVGSFLFFSAAATAGAAPGPDLAAASNAAHSAQASQLLDKAAAQLIQRSGVSASSKAASAKASLVVQQDVVPIYALNPEFVRSTSTDVGTLWYVATKATKGSAVMTVYTAPDKAGGWQPVNIASGDTEAKMAAAAHGAKVLTEPQIGAWYAVSGNRIRALDVDATKAIGSKPISLTAYRQQVAARYADKQAGSAYAENGTAGGYDVTGGAAAAVAGAKPIAAAAEVANAASPTEDGGHGRWVTAAGATVVALCALVVFFTRRRSLS